MGPEVVNKNKNCVFNGPYAGRDLYITMYQDSEREFVVTHNANIKPVSYFTGRETELQDLHQKIEEGCKAVLVSGMGGIGKTQICRKLFKEYLNKHDNNKNEIFWHIGYIEYNGDMDSSLQSCLKFKQQKSTEQNQEAAWRELEYLASNGKLLLFIDNVDKSMSEDTSLQKLNTIPGAIILTSRQVSFSDEFEAYPIGFLDTKQCMELFERIRFGGSGKKISLEEIPDLEYIIERLTGKHTITVELLVHLARTKLWTVKRLRKELEEKGFRLAFHKDGELINIQESYEVLYDLSGLTKAERNILEAFSVFPYIPLEAEICNQWLLADAGVSEDDDILMGLYQKGWLQFDMEQERYAMHPVFSQFLSNKFKIKIKKHLGLREGCIRNLVIAKDVSAIECQKYIPFVENILDKVNMGREIKNLKYISLILGWLALGLYKEKIKQGEFIYAYISTLLTIRKYKNVEKWSKKYIQICEDVWGKRHIKTAESYELLANLYYWQGKYREAEKLYEKSLRINKKKFGEESIIVARSYYYIAQLYELEGKYREAEELYKKSLEINKKTIGEESVYTAISYKGIAQIYIRYRDFERAEKLFIKALKIINNNYTVENSMTAIFYNDLAGVYSRQGKYKKSKELYEKSMQIRKKLSGEESLDMAESYKETHPDIAIVFDNLAQVYEAQEEDAKAERFYKKSIEINVRTYGENHPNVARSYYNLAGLYKKRKEYQNALYLFVKALKIQSVKLGMEHPDIKIIYKRMKETYSEWNPKGNFYQWLEEQMIE